MTPLHPGVTRESLLAELGDVIRISWPAIITMLSHTAMQFVDTWMLAGYGKDELAAVSPAGLMYYVVAAFMMGVISCNNTFVGQSVGKGLPRDGARYTVHAVYLGLAFQAVMLPLLALSGPLFNFFGHEPEVRVLENVYFRLRVPQLAATGMVMAFSTFFQATERPIIPMLTGITANLLNVLGDWLFIYGHWGMPEWGIAGAAGATTVSSYIEAALLLGVFLSPRQRREYGTDRWRPFEMKKFLQLLRIGMGAGVNWLLDMASWAIFSNWIVGKLGKDVLAGNNAAMSIMHLSFMPALGLNIGITALVGRHVGAKEIPRAKRAAYMGMACAAVYMGFMGVVFFVFRDPLIRWFNDDPGVLQAGKIILMYAACYQFTDAIGILSYGGLKGAGDTKFPAIVSAVVAWCFFLPLGYFLGRKDVLGLHGAWIAVVAYVWVMDAILLWRFIGERWRKIDIFE